MGRLSKTKGGRFLPWDRGGEGGSGLFTIRCNFLTKSTLASPGNNTPGARLLSPRPSEGCGRPACSKEEGSGFWARLPLEGLVTVARGRAVKRRGRGPRCSPRLEGAGEGQRSGGAGGGRGGRLGAEAGPPVPSLLSSHSDSAEVRRAEAGNKRAAWGGERLGRGRAPGPLPEDPGRRKPKCHLNSTQEVDAWGPTASFSSNGWNVSHKLPESRPVRRKIARLLRPCSWSPQDPSIASRWKGSSRMKSKKGKAPRLSPSGHESRGNVLARPRRAGARVTW